MRFTTKGDTLYAILLGWPEGGEATIAALSSNLPLRMEAINRVELVGMDSPLPWRRDAAGLHVTLPGDPLGDHAFTLRIQ